MMVSTFFSHQPKKAKSAKNRINNGEKSLFISVAYLLRFQSEKELLQLAYWQIGICKSV
jgi:hypothetical protein